MAKAKFERTKPHVNIGTIGHVDQLLLQQLLLRLLHYKVLQKRKIMLISTLHQKKEKEVLQSILLTLNMKLLSVTTLTLTAQDTLTMLRT